jgi:transcription elongation GreA/GreB family factor
MSSAFTREQDDATSPADVGERPVSQHRNLVTVNGLTMIDTQIAVLKEELARAEAEADRERIMRASRDLRYWTARRETAEVSVPDPDSTVVRFGMTVTLAGDDDVEHVWKIVGEDEADASHGRISHVSPLAIALFGKSVGDVVEVSGHEWEIVALDAVQ